VGYIDIGERGEIGRLGQTGGRAGRDGRAVCSGRGSVSPCRETFSKAGGTEQRRADGASGGRGLTGARVQVAGAQPGTGEA
jgi:hypothetical protein